MTRTSPVALIFGSSFSHAGSAALASRGVGNDDDPSRQPWRIGSVIKPFVFRHRSQGFIT
jgi:hypothetical protein